MKTRKMIGGIEGGGTKFNAILVEEPATFPTTLPKVYAEKQFTTTTPLETIAELIAFFQSEAKGNLQAVGLGCFGPLDLDPSSSTYGQITTTPKPGWGGADLPTTLEQALQVPVYIDTDVNAAAVGEYLWGAGQGVTNLLYMTVGTGIGGGCVLDGKPFHGLNHPEMGHIPVPHDWDKDPFNGVCQYHGDCLEGLASGPALLERWETPGESLPQNHPAWRLEAKYLGAALATYALILSPQRMILGGGIMKQSFLWPMIRREFLAELAGYISHPSILSGVEEYITPPALGDRVGVLGAIGIALINR